ncbi:MAG: chemotaxis protein CheX [Bdellovibrionales bacterium]|nr:chemotaxis protein CheX [Bdellovibrionales bacterium]
MASPNFEITQKEQVTIIKCLKEFGQSAADEIENLSAEWLKKPSKIYVFDFQEAGSVSNVTFKPMATLNRSLKKVESFLFSINVSKDIERQIKMAGLDDVFNVKTDLSAAMAGAGVKVAKPTLDANFINPFIQSTQKTIQTQANTQVNAGRLRLKQPGEVFETDIAGVISLTSNVFTGAIALCFPQETFLAMYSNMLGERHTVITPEIEDAAGELLNIIFGQAKAELNQNKGYVIERAIPTVVRGKNINIHHMSRSLSVVLPFETSAGKFHIEISADFV